MEKLNDSIHLISIYLQTGKWEFSSLNVCVSNSGETLDKQGVALMGRNTTGPRAVSSAQPPTRQAAGALTVHAPSGRPTRPPAVLQTTTDPSQRN